MYWKLKAESLPLNDHLQFTASHLKSGTWTCFETVGLDPIRVAYSDWWMCQWINIPLALCMTHWLYITCIICICLAKLDENVNPCYLRGQMFHRSISQTVDRHITGPLPTKECCLAEQRFVGPLVRFVHMLCCMPNIKSGSLFHFLAIETNERWHCLDFKVLFLACKKFLLHLAEAGSSKMVLQTVQTYQ